MLIRVLIGLICSLTLAINLCAAETASDAKDNPQQNDANVSNPAENCSKAAADIKNIAKVIEKQADDNIALEQIQANFALLKRVAVRCASQEIKSNVNAHADGEAQNISATSAGADCGKQLRDIGARVDKIAELLGAARRNETDESRKQVLQQVKQSVAEIRKMADECQADKSSESQQEKAK